MDNTNLPSPPKLPISLIESKIYKLNSFLESLHLVPSSFNTQLVCMKENDGDLMFVEIIKKYDDSNKEELEEDDNVVMGEELGIVKFTNETDEIAYMMPHKIEQFKSLSNMEKEHRQSVYVSNEEDKKRGVYYVMNKILEFWSRWIQLYKKSQSYENVFEVLKELPPPRLHDHRISLIEGSVPYSVENLVPNPSKSEDECECDVPACDDFTTFFNLLFDADDDFSSSGDKLFSDEDILKEIYLDPLFNEEIISIKIDPYHLNVEFDLIESLLNQDSSIISSSKIDSLLDEFADEVILLKSIPPGIDEADCDPEKEIRLIEKFLYDNSSPRPPKEFIS
nr:retrotransposon Orf1 [Tanacetum cinerariifolium]